MIALLDIMTSMQKQQSLYNGKVLLDKHDPPTVYDSEETLQLAQEWVFVSQSAKSRDESYFSNTSKMAIVSKSISIPNEEFSDDTTPSVARKFLNEEIYKILKDEISPIVNQVDARVQNFEIQFLKEAAKFVRDFKSLANEADESLNKQKTLELEIDHLLRAVVRVDNTAKTRRPQPRSNTKNDRVPSESKSRCIKNKQVEVEEHHRDLMLSKNKKHMSSECNNVKLAIRNDKFEIVCAIYLEVAFRRNTCFIRNLEGVDLLKGNRTTNLYTINLHEMASASPICLIACATSTKSWLWNQRLSHLNFDTIKDLAKNDLVTGLPKFRYHKEHLCPSCEQGKSKRHLTHPNLF
ncbi:retrovirus-related pol polyprotein from transposon TNT 1-94, partial [Tanacetum coccineum]